MPGSAGGVTTSEHFASPTPFPGQAAGYPGGAAPTGSCSFAATGGAPREAAREAVAVPRRPAGGRDGLANPANDGRRRSRGLLDEARRFGGGEGDDAWARHGRGRTEGSSWRWTAATRPGGRREAVALAADQGARLRFVYVVELPYPYDDAAVDFAAIAEPQRELGQSALDEASVLAREAGVEPEAALVSTYGGRISEALVEDAGSWQADLIVMGARGRGLLGKLLGSVAEGVVRTASVPVMLLRAA